MLLLLFGCEPHPEPGPPSCVPDSVSGVELTADPVNLLRYRVVVADAGSATTLRVWDATGDASMGWDVAVDVDGSASIWGLRFNTTYEVQVADGGVATCVTTVPRPAAFPTAEVGGLGASGVNYVLANLRSGDDQEEMLAIFDNEGEMVWYELVSTLTGSKDDFYDGYSWDPVSRSVYSIVNHDRIVQYALDGTVLRLWGAETLNHAMSHEVRVIGGRLYVLVTDSFQDAAGDTFLSDGYQVYADDGTREREWFLRDHGLSLATDPMPRAHGRDTYWDETFGTAATDWTHINSLDVTGAGADEAVFLSLRNLDQLVKVDVASGEIVWQLGANGAGGAHSGGDFQLLGGNRWFFSQHHLTAGPDGDFLVYDNGDGADHTRAIEFSVDEAAGTVTYGTLHGLRRSCSVSRGAAYRLQNGNVLATCGNDAQLQEFDGLGLPVWSLQFDCRSAEGACVLYRGIPVDSITETEG